MEHVSMEGLPWHRVYTMRCVKCCTVELKAMLGMTSQPFLAVPFPAMYAKELHVYVRITLLVNQILHQVRVAKIAGVVKQGCIRLAIEANYPSLWV